MSEDEKKDIEKSHEHGKESSSKEHHKEHHKEHKENHEHEKKEHEQHHKHNEHKEATHHKHHKKHHKEHSHAAHKKETKKNFFAKNSSTLWIASIVLVIFVALLILNNEYLANQHLQANNPTPGQSNAEFSGTPADLHFYVMSQCPYGTQVTTNIEPVIEKLGKALNFKLDYILYPKDQYAGREAQMCIDGLCSMHGKQEVLGDIVQLCAAKYNPDKFIKMIKCQNENPRQIPDNWEECAKKYNLDVDKIKACFKGEEGKELLRQSAKNSEEVKATGSPTIYLNGKEYTGGRQTSSFLRTICSSFSGTKPDACLNLPEPVKVNVIVLNDKRCDDCKRNMPGLISSLKSIFPGLNEIDYDYSDAKGKELYNKFNLTYLPAIIFDSTVKKGEGYSNIQRYLLELDNNSFLLRIGAKFDPTAEICGNGIDDDNNGKTDCDDPKCAAEWSCVEKTDKPKVELFVMSYCPFGTQMEKAVLPVAQLLGDKIDFSIKFVSYAMHGKKEIDENIRQYCIQKEQNDKYFDYLNCFLKSGEYSSCLDSADIDKDKLSVCMNNTDNNYNITNMFNDKSTWLSGRYPQFPIDEALNKKYSVRGSPTLVINGARPDNVQRSPKSILSKVCFAFEDKPAECNEKLSSSQPKPGFGEGTSSGDNSNAQCS